MSDAFITILEKGDKRSRVHHTLLVPLDDDSEILMPSFGENRSQFTNNVVFRPRRRPRDGSWPAIWAWVRSWRNLLRFLWWAAR